MEISDRKANRAAIDGLLELAPDRLIALCRVLLAGLSLSAIMLDPTQPVRLAPLTYGVLSAYLIAAAAVAVFVSLRRFSTRQAYIAHAVDISVAVVLMLFTEGPTSPFFAFFTFNLLAATLQWKTRGAVVTSALLLLVFGAMLIAPAALPSLDADPDQLNRSVIRLAYLSVTAVLMTYLGAYLELGRRRITDLANWPPGVGDGSEPVSLGMILAHAGRVVDVPRLVAVWERDGEPGRHVVECRDGAATQHGIRAGDGPLVSPGMEGKAFASEDLDTELVMFADGQTARVARPIDPALTGAFGIRSVVSAPIRATACRGRVFLLDRPHWLPDHIALAEAIGSRLGLDLDHLALRAAREREAAEVERLRLSRDVHDGILQGLTAADLQLTSGLEKSEPATRDLLSSVRSILKTEQRRLREFVEISRDTAGRPGETDIGLMTHLHQPMEELAHRWGCRVGLDVVPQDAACDRPTARLLLHILSEAVANASRHGRASSVSVALSVEADVLQARIRDDGKGWTGLSGTYSWDELSKNGIGPRSIIDRTEDSNGELSLATSPRGTELKLILPLRVAA